MHQHAQDLLAVADASTELYSRLEDPEPVEKSKLYGTTLNKYIKVCLHGAEPSPIFLLTDMKREGAAPPPPPPPSTKSSTYVVPVKKPLTAKEPVAAVAAPPVSTHSTAKDSRREAKDFFSNARTKKEEPLKSSQSSNPSAPSKTKIPLKRGQSDLKSSFSNAQPKKTKQPEKEESPSPPGMGCHITKVH
ncbi:hypothetical protein ABW21_db0200310 [Orbilia brochopaga]|nr:hypothetical protein ABW21_db0200310 [Drechslerella brochopaga]